MRTNAKTRSIDPIEMIAMAIEIETENKVSVNIEINFSEEEEIDFSGLDYDELISHLTEIMEENVSSDVISHSRSYYTSLFEALIELSEFQPERMERTLVILGLAFNMIEVIRLSNEEEPLWDIDNEFDFPIPKEKIQMSLDGLETPYNWRGEYENIDLEVLNLEDKNIVASPEEVNA